MSKDWCYFMFLLHYHSLYHRIGVILYSCYTTILYVTGLVLFYVFVTLPFFVSQDGVILYSCYTTILYVTGLVLFYVFVT